MDDAGGPTRLETAPGGPAPVQEKDSQQCAPAPEASFSEFYRQHAGSLVAFLIWQGAGVEEAAEIAQETMARAWAGWERITSRLPPPYPAAAASERAFRHTHDSPRDWAQRPDDT